MNRPLLLLLLPLALAGCASGPATPVHVDVPDIARSASVTVRDARPPTEATRQIMSYLVTSDAYGVIRQGDLDTEPSAMRLIQHRVFERLGPGAHATVHHLVLYQNMQSQGRAGAIGAVFGLIGAVIASSQYDGTIATAATLVDRKQFEALTGDDEWKRAIYTPAENPNKVTVIVSYLDLDVDGKRAFVRIVSPLKVEGGKNPFVLSLQATIDEAVKQLPDASTAPAVAALPAVPATPAPAAPPPPQTTGEAPANAMHLDRTVLEGRTLSYPHPRDPAAYGDVRLAFAGDAVTASNARSHASGRYTLNNDELCMSFDSPSWQPYCVYVLRGDAGDANARRVLFPHDGKTLPASLR